MGYDFTFELLDAGPPVPPLAAFLAGIGATPTTPVRNSQVAGGSESGDGSRNTTSTPNSTPNTTTNSTTTTTTHSYNVPVTALAPLADILDALVAAPPAWRLRAFAFGLVSLEDVFLRLIGEEHEEREGGSK